MYFIDKRIQVICDELRRERIRDRSAMGCWSYKKGLYFRPEEAEADTANPWEHFDCAHMHWYGPDEHYWFRADLTVPQEFAGRSVWMNVRTQIDEYDDGKNPQFLLFVNGEVEQGLDMNHREVRLTERAAGGETFRIDMQAYTGTLYSEFNLIVELYWLDEEVDGLYYDLQVPLWAFPRMDEDDKNRLDIQTVLNDAVNRLDLRRPYSPEYYAGVAAARELLEERLYKGMGGWHDVVATCIGHTHIDVAWWWTVAQVREKVARSFATVLKLMDEYPDYRFMSSQCVLYDFLRQRYPEVYARVKERVAEGRWEPEGGMWVESDTNLTSGESLVRQFVHGKRFFKDEFGVDCRILWLPDVFGYSGALPQIMKRSGIDYFMTTKLAWNQIDKIPNDTFIWRGIDGSEVLTHLITTVDVGQDVKKNFFTTYNGRLHPDAIMGGWERYQNKEINNDILVAFGHGDGGGGPTREMLEVAKRMKRGVKGIPQVRQEFAGEYFRELEARVKDNPRLDTWEGELYFEYHRGTLTSMARNKRANRKNELLLMDLELASVMAQDKLAYPGQELDGMWKTMLTNQFHDILPGSSIHEVYEVTKAEYEALSEQAHALLGERLRSLAGEGRAVAVFNTLGFERDDIVSLPDTGCAALSDGEGRVFPVQRTAEGAVAYVRGLPPKGYKSLLPADCAAAESPFTLEGDTLTTPFYRVTLDENGHFSSIYDRENGREVVQAGRRANLLRMFEDKPIYYDNWDIDEYYTEKSWDVDNLTKLEWTETGPVRATLHLEYEIAGVAIWQDVRFYADSRRIDFETVVDWTLHQHLLKVEFPVAVHSDEATFDVQFGSLKRKVHKNTSWDKARFEYGGQKWMDFSEGHYGVALLNDCKYGHSVHDGVLSLTLIKSGIEPNPMADVEMHHFTYSILPHSGGWREGGVVREGYKLNQPAYALANAAEGLDFSFAGVQPANIIMETVKCAEDGEGTVLRLYECDDALTKASIRLPAGARRAWSCDLLEERERELEICDGCVEYTFKPFEIVTIRCE